MAEASREEAATLERPKSGTGDAAKAYGNWETRRVRDVKVYEICNGLGLGSNHVDLRNPSVGGEVNVRVSVFATGYG